MKNLEKRLEQLNKVIDRKIIAGKSYKKEAREHADLRAFINDHRDEK